MSQTRLPNLFIVGAPKCGTSAFAEEYLNGHPHIFMSRLKEPHHFNTDFPNHRIVRHWDEYLQLFAPAAPEHRWLGEASVWYLYSQAALPAIRALVPAARLLVFLRNPVEMVYSLHSQLLHATEEVVADFEAAWSLQEARRRGLHLPTVRHVPEFLQYRQACSLGAQVARLYASFPSEQVKLLFLDDIRSDPRRVYLEVLAFLDLADDGRLDFPVINANKQRRWLSLARWQSNPPIVMQRTWKLLTHFLGRQAWLAHRLLAKIDTLNSRVAPRRQMPLAIREMLTTAFADDIALLGRLSGRDLGHWLKPPQAGKTRPSRTP